MYALTPAIYSIIAEWVAMLKHSHTNQWSRLDSKSHQGWERGTTVDHSEVVNSSPLPPSLPPASLVCLPAERSREAVEAPQYLGETY
jgi:hypothetical protein